MPRKSETQENRTTLWRPTVIAAGLAAILELLIAIAAGLPLAPFVICLVGSLFLLSYAAKLRPIREDVVGRLLAVVLLLKVLSVFVGVTGGISSPFGGLLFLPVFLAALFFGVVGSLLTAFVACLVLGGLLLLNTTPVPSASVVNGLVQCGVLLAVSCVAGVFAQQMTRTATAARSRARFQERRASEVEWLTDTTVMMESLHDLEPMLSVALLRLGDLVACDTATVFMRDADDPTMRLVQSMGLSADQLTVRSIPLTQQNIVHNAEFGAHVWPDVRAGLGEMGLFASVDSEAESAILVPLRTLDDVFGVILLTAHRPEAFSEADRDRLVKFARHIVYPIQRVRLQAMATTDALTGLDNRRAFRARLRDEVERTRRYGHPLALLMIDIDHFKKVNDTLGHRSGDAILTQIGGILTRSGRGTDRPARYGGEELAILCPETTAAEAYALAERVLTMVRAHVFALPDGRETQITVSVGVASIPAHALDASALVEEADAALYEAKASGRDRACIAQQRAVAIATGERTVEPTPPGKPTATARG
jgi:diguanylate cyclase (GGDEF)-like protein